MTSTRLQKPWRFRHNGQPVFRTSTREAARRLRQIAAGRITAANRGKAP